MEKYKVDFSMEVTKVDEHKLHIDIKGARQENDEEPTAMNPAQIVQAILQMLGYIKKTVDPDESTERTPGIVTP